MNSVAISALMLPEAVDTVATCMCFGPYITAVVNVEIMLIRALTTARIAKIFLTLT